MGKGRIGLFPPCHRIEEMAYFFFVRSIAICSNRKGFPERPVGAIEEHLRSSILRRENAGRTSEFPSDGSFAPDDFAATTPCALYKREVHAAQCSRCVTQEKLGETIHREADARCRENRGKFKRSCAKVPECKIDLVNAIKQHSSLLRVRAVTIFVRYRAPPMRKKGSGADARGEDVADRMLREEFFNELRAGVETPVAAEVQKTRM